MLLPPAGGLGAMAVAAEDPATSTEWTNATMSSDFGSAGNFSSGAPVAAGEVYLADAPATPAGKMISVTGPHSIHLITVANSTGPDYTIGLSPHSGSFDFGGGGSIDVYAGLTTINNCDVFAPVPSATLPSASPIRRPCWSNMATSAARPSA
jgi:hypothetical protein